VPIGKYTAIIAGLNVKVKFFAKKQVWGLSPNYPKNLQKLLTKGGGVRYH
jgi:hypothetical protein